MQRVASTSMDAASREAGFRRDHRGKPKGRPEDSTLNAARGRRLLLERKRLVQDSASAFVETRRHTCLPFGLGAFVAALLLLLARFADLRLFVLGFRVVPLGFFCGFRLSSLVSFHFPATWSRHSPPRPPR